MPTPLSGVVATPSSGPAASPNTRSSTRRQARTRTRDDMDLDSEPDTDSAHTSPHPTKVARTSIGSDASSSGSSPNTTDCGTTCQAEDQEAPPKDHLIAQALMDELECGMCAGVYIEPLALNGCGHVFCGSCVQQWIKSIPIYPPTILPGDKMPEPIACPQCRHSPIQNATPSRVAKTLVNFLVERYPAAARAPEEVRQAEEIYTAARGALKFPNPPAPPRMNQSDYWSPCRWCYTEGEGAWKCPVPVPRFNVPAERPNCIRNDGLCPDGHRLCAGCDRLSPVGSPSSATCGICGEGFCGEVASSCDCPVVSKAKPSGQYNSLSYLLEDCSTDMLSMAFRDNWTEMCALGGYLGATPNAPKTEDIFRDILVWLRTPEAIDSGGLLGLMTRAEINLRLRTGAANEMQNAIMPVEQGQTEQRMCAGCSDDIFCAGILEWWTRELKKPEVAAKLPAHLQGRDNCKLGFKCNRQDNDRHSRKYNHICQPMPAEEAALLVQDDSLPNPNASTVGVNPNALSSSTAPSESGSDDDDDEEDDDDDGDDSQEANNEPQVVIQGAIATQGASSTRIDASTQYDDHPSGTELIGHSTELQTCWNILPPAAALLPNGIQASTRIPPAFQPSTPIPPTLSGSAIIPALVQPTHVGNLASPPALRLPSPQQFATSTFRVPGSASSPLSAHGSWSHYRRAGSPAVGLSQAGNASTSTDPNHAHSSPHQLPKYTVPTMSKSSPLYPSYGMTFPTLDPWVPGAMNNDS